MREEGHGLVRIEHRELGLFHLSFDEPDTTLFCENETNMQRVFGVAGQSGHPKDAFHDYVVGGRQDAVNSAKVGTKAAGLYRRDVPAGGSIVLRARLRAGEPIQNRFEGFAAGLCDAPGRGRCLLCGPAGPHRRRGLAAHPAAGLRRHAVEQAVLSLQRLRVAGWRPGPAAASREPQVRPQQEMAAHDLRRRDLDARQMGISLVRCLGSRLSLRHVLAHRSGLRQEPADPALQGLHDASGRGIAGLRMGLRRRQPAGPCLGGPARLR